MKISENINAAGGNLARPTKFNALIIPPAILSGGFEEKSFDVMCKTIGVPETVLESMDMTFKGHTLKVPGRVNQMQEITVTFYLDEYHKLRRIFYDWINAMDERSPADKSIRTADLMDMGYENPMRKFGDIILIARDFGESMNEPMNYIFERVYPTNVGGVEFNTAGTNEILEFTVTFAFFKYRHYDYMPDEITTWDEILDGGA